MVSRLAKFFEALNFKLRAFYAKRKKTQQICSQEYKKIYKNTKISPTQKKEIQNYFIKFYGKKIPLFWHKYYMSFTNKLDIKFFPEHLYYVLERKLNPVQYRYVYEDKNHLTQLFFGIKEVKIPLTYVSCTNGFFRDSNFNLISEQDARKIVSDKGKFFVKPTINTNSGKGCQIIDFATTTNPITFLGENFAIQQIIYTDSTIAKLNPTSVNGFRITTVLLDDGEIFVTPSIMRIGVDKSIVDNINVGGIFIGISEDGFLQKYAFSKSGKKFSEHPTSGVVFENYQIPLFPKARAAAKILHQRIPHCRIASWDLTIDSHGIINLIEVNLTAQGIWLPQIAWGECIFGVHTSGLLKKIYKQ